MSILVIVFYGTYALAMSFINKLSFVKKQLENDDVYTFYFSLPKSLKHKAGQHGLFIIPGLYRPHPFTLSSAPEEEFVTITTHVNTGSRYKKKLLSMKRGGAMILLGPILEFTYKIGRNNHVFLAQGVGITPFRSMLLHAHSSQLHVETTLIHVDSKHHTFKNLTEKYATHALYPTSPSEFKELLAKQNVNQMYYVSGSPKFTKLTIELLVQRGVSKKDIKTDSFLGY